MKSDATTQEDTLFGNEDENQEESEESKTLDWQSETENLSEGGNGGYWSPPTGKTDITFLEVIEEYRDQKKFDDEEKQYVTFRIEVDGDEYKWDMKKGSTPGSKFGQIARYAAAKDGLEGESVTWFRQGQDQQTNHVLMDLEDVENGGGQ